MMFLLYVSAALLYVSAADHSLYVFMELSHSGSKHMTNATLYVDYTPLLRLNESSNSLEWLNVSEEFQNRTYTLYDSVSACINITRNITGIQGTLSHVIRILIFCTVLYYNADQHFVIRSRWIVLRVHDIGEQQSIRCIHSINRRI